mgnify:CR=1 FL=1
MNKFKHILVMVLATVCLVVSLCLIAACGDKYTVTVPNGDYHEGQLLPELNLTSGEGTIK